MLNKSPWQRIACSSAFEIKFNTMLNEAVDTARIKGIGACMLSILSRHSHSGILLTFYIWTLTNESSHLNQINVNLIRISNERANKWQNWCGKKKSFFYCTHSDETQTLPMNRDEERKREITSERDRKHENHIS